MPGPGTGMKKHPAGRILFSMNSWCPIHITLISIALCALAPASALAQGAAETGFVTLEESGLFCGPAIKPGQVLVVDNEGREYEAGELKARLDDEVGSYTLASNEPILVPKHYTDGKTRRQFMVRDTRQAIAGTGCDLLVILGIEFVDKQWEDPNAVRLGVKRQVTVGYALVLAGTRGP